MKSKPKKKKKTLVNDVTLQNSYPFPSFTAQCQSYYSREKLELILDFRDEGRHVKIREKIKEKFETFNRLSF